MPWIARDRTGSNPYRIFGMRPFRMHMVSYDGEVRDDFTWSFPDATRNIRNYGPLSNTENTVLPEAYSPVHLEPGEGPVEVRLSLTEKPTPRPFEGSGI